MSEKRNFYEDWNLFNGTNEGAALNEFIRDFLHSCTEDLLENAEITLPALWWPDDDGHGNSGVDDPLAFGLWDSDTDTLYKMLFPSRAIEDAVQDLEHDGSYGNGLARMSEAFKKFAARIDAAIEKHGLEPLE